MEFLAPWFCHSNFHRCNLCLFFIENVLYSFVFFRHTYIQTTIREMAYESVLVLVQFVPIFQKRYLRNPLCSVTWIISVLLWFPIHAIPCMAEDIIIHLCIVLTIVKGRDERLTCNYLCFWRLWIGNYFIAKLWDLSKNIWRNVQLRGTQTCKNDISALQINADLT